MPHTVFSRGMVSVSTIVCRFDATGVNFVLGQHTDYNFLFVFWHARYNPALKYF